MPIPRGRILGGSHAINLAVYSRGNRQDYDNWANNLGATGWSYQDVLPYFLMSENNTDPNIVAANPRFHSTTGPVEITSTINPDRFITRVMNATYSLGWPRTDLGNLENQYGSTLIQTTQSRIGPDKLPRQLMWRLTLPDQIYMFW